jgi:hypothetical protein
VDWAELIAAARTTGPLYGAAAAGAGAALAGSALWRQRRTVARQGPESGTAETPPHTAEHAIPAGKNAAPANGSHDRSPAATRTELADRLRHAAERLERLAAKPPCTG